MGNKVRVPIKFKSHPLQPLLSGRVGHSKIFQKYLQGQYTKAYLNIQKKLSGGVELYGHSEYILYPKKITNRL